MKADLPDAERLTCDYVKLVAEAPFRLTPERNAELIKDVFNGQVWDIFFIAPTNPRHQGFFARPLERNFSVTFAALLSLWGISAAALILAAEAAKAAREGRHELPVETGTPAATAIALVEASKAILLNPQGPWPANLPSPEPNAAEGTQGWHVNNVFLAAVGWVLFHEIAHVHLKHEEVTSNAIILSQEEEADDWATEKVLGAASEQEKEFRIFSVTTACAWLGVWDAAAGTASTHPHPSRRLLAASNHFSAPDESPGLELATYVVKALFDPSTKMPEMEGVGEAFDQVVWSYLRSPRWSP